MSSPKRNSIIIAAKNLKRIYATDSLPLVALNDISFTVNKGEIIILKGNSGSGKSTLLALLAGLDHPTSGSLTVADHDLHLVKPRDLTMFRRNEVGMIFQSFNLLPTLTVFENICMPAMLAGKSLSKIKPKAEQLLIWLNMVPRRHSFPSQLSGGEMQRTAIARALINNPGIILADEPTGNLDSYNGQAVINLLKTMNRRWQCTVIIATHSNLADDLASKKFILKDGMLS